MKQLLRAQDKTSRLPPSWRLSTATNCLRLTIPLPPMAKKWGSGPSDLRRDQIVQSNNEYRSKVRKIMRERGDFLFAQGIGDICHRRHAAADSQA